MGMIKKITLINFQVHKRLELEVNERFNVWTGANDSGKSSIIRAMYWAFYNQPSGDWMQRIDRSGKKRVTTVKILFADDTLLIRKKGDGINLYKVDGEKYENFGYSIPEQVAEKLRMYPLETNKEIFNINVGMQDDKAFLIHESAPARASVLDVLTGNSIIQKAISSFGKESIAKSKQISMLEQSIIEDEESLKSLPDIDKADELARAAQYTHEDLYVNWIPILEWLQKDLKEWEEYDVILKDTEKYIIDIEPIQQLHRKYLMMRIETNKLHDLLDDYESHKDNIIDIPDLSYIIELAQKDDKLLCEVEKLKELKAEYNEVMQDLEICNNEIYCNESLLERLKKKNPQCPTCGKDWK